ncbi:hypothetical protein BHE90_010425 [Fusarium euwallaceae]|uniref:Fucose-specific lectin n=3 Tax=Fusarium solani species complex TaxID=232080 RepID=A0A428TIR3_9HYPO|nr:hypothetical protein CEP51_000782 [Fusarium floridanum]RSM01924.1 hypothetical protein CEP52_008279 [Fusarium oligoseptatum]RTE75096.1 hypothetical protein BHE90_010425 [Fusarium euwallaceae]
MTDPLQDVTAVVTPVANQDIVFHITEDGDRRKISFWSSKNPDEKRGRQYNTENLKISGNPIFVNSGLPNLAAVAYKNPHTDQDEVRVYYVHQNSLTVREIRRTGDGDWYEGQVFNQQSTDIAATSGLTANVVTIRTKVSDGNCDHDPVYKTEYQLKVYYQRKPDVLNVSYSVLSQSDENWATRNGVNQ